MNRIDKLIEMRKEKKEGILSVTMPPACLWDFNYAYELVDMLRRAGLNQLLYMIGDADSMKMAEVAPVEVELLLKGLQSGYRTELISEPQRRLRAKYPELAMVNTVHIGEALCYGINRFIEESAELGIDAIDNCAYRYVEDPIGFRRNIRAHGMYHFTAIFAKIIDHANPQLMEIVKNMVDKAEGELFVVPGMMGVIETLSGEEMKVYVDFIRERQAQLGKYVPLIGIGGVRSPEQAADLVHVADIDGVHTSTAFMQKLLTKEPFERIEAYLKEFKDAVNGK